MSGSSSYASSSFSSSSTNGQVTGHHTTQRAHTDESGNTTIERSHQNLGEPARVETRSFDRQGRQLMTGEVEEASDRMLEGGNKEPAGGPTIEDVTDEQSTRDKQYEEAMEDEYAKREGGA